MCIGIVPLNPCIPPCERATGAPDEGIGTQALFYFIMVAPLRNYGRSIIVCKTAGITPQCLTAMCILCPRFAESDYFFTDTLKIMVLQNQCQK
jgi:hypothetical protein